MTTREQCARLDAASPLPSLRDRFELPEGVLYLDGNSLGPLPATAAGHVERVLRVEWGERLIRSWQEAGWWEQPLRLGDLVAGIVGASNGEVAVCDSISVNLFKVLTAAARLRPERRVLVVESGGFTTDRYLAGSVASMLGLELRVVEPAWQRWLRQGAGNAGAGGVPPALEDALDESVAAVLLGHVDYRSAYRYDLSETTALVQAVGALAVWDLAHSAGAVTVDLGAAGADLAVGCGYKYLNGGPGAPAFLYVAERHLEAARQPITGWHGHADPFLFTDGYEPAPGIRRFLAGTPPVVAYAALEAALELWDDIDLTTVEAASRSLSGVLVDLVAERAPSLELASPPDPARRGSHVSFRHPDAQGIVAELARLGVLADARQPDLVRLALTPLYLRHVDVYDAVEVLAAVLAGIPAGSPARSRAGAPARSSGR